MNQSDRIRLMMNKIVKLRAENKLLKEEVKKLKFINIQLQRFTSNSTINRIEA